MNITFYLHDEKDPKALENLLHEIGKKYKFVSWQEVYDYYYKGLDLHNTCHITIDDGWLSTYTIIYPILRKLNIPASIFVSPRITLSGENFWYYDIKQHDENSIKDFLIKKGLFKNEVRKYPLELILKEMKIDDVISVINEYKSYQNLLNNERGFMNLEEIKELSDSGLIEVGAHTMIHPILSNETKERSSFEIKNSIEYLSKILNKEINIFAYPNGLYGLDYSKREMEIVKSCGIKLAFSVNPGEYKRGGDPFNIPRVCSLSRLKLGKLGLILPSLHDQNKPRTQIRKLKLK